jgi:hypothetical protein
MALHAPDVPTQDQQTNAFIRKQNLTWNAVLLGDFFDQLYICISKNICDRPLAITMLGRDIEVVGLENGAYLAEERKLLTGFTGCGFQALYDLAHGRLEDTRGQRPGTPPKPRTKMKLARNRCPPI